jgi:serine/threonine-protein kinase
MINLKISSLLTSLALIFTSIAVEAQTVRKSLPMTISTSEGYYDLTVPDTQTTKSAFGGKLRIYDVHIAKMFEVTYLDCQKFGQGLSREWSYFAGNGNINMGTFYIPCKLVYDIVAAYGLGPSKNTPIIYGQEEAGSPYTKMVSVPTLNLNGGKEQKWINFTKNFKPVSR